MSGHVQREVVPVQGLIGVKSAKRYQAFVVDNLLSIICFFGTATVIRDLLPKTRSTAIDVTIYISLATLYLLYFWISEAVFSTTPGKAWFGLCVRNIDGSKCGPKGAFIRAFSRFIEVNPVLLGALPAVLLVLMTERKQRLGALLAGTVVVEKRSLKS